MTPLSPNACDQITDVITRYFGEPPHIRAARDLLAEGITEDQFVAFINTRPNVPSFVLAAVHNGIRDLARTPD